MDVKQRGAVLLDLTLCRVTIQAMFARASLVFAVVLAGPGWACPPVPDTQAARADLHDKVRVAGSEGEARELSNALWRIWTKAPDDKAQALLDQGMGRRASYDFAGAVESFDALIDYCPHYAEGWNQRAFAHFLRQDYGAALDDLERALELVPNHFGALSGRGLTLLGLGRIKAGEASIRAALELNPWLPERGYLNDPPPLPGTKL